MVDFSEISKEWERLRALYARLEPRRSGGKPSPKRATRILDDSLHLLERCIEIGSQVDDPALRSDLQAKAREVSNSIFTYFNQYSPSAILPFEPRGKRNWNGIYQSDNWPQIAPVLYGRSEELEMLDNAWNSGHPKIIVLVGWGGIGKTSIVTRWILDHLLSNSIRRPDRIFCWSFENQTNDHTYSSVDQFLEEAYCRFSEEPLPETHGTKNYSARGQHLAELVRTRPTVLVIDGLESLQEKNSGKINQPAIHKLLWELACSGRECFCVITTRLRVDELAQFAEHSVQQIEVPPLDPKEGARYLNDLGVSGSEAERAQASCEYEGHPLTLTLLGKYLNVAYRGDIRSRDKIPRLLSERAYGRRASLIVEGYAELLGEKPDQLQVLLLLSLFDYSTGDEEISAILAEPAIPGLTDQLLDPSNQKLKYALASLAEINLVTGASKLGRYESHPIVREYFSALLKAKHPNAWREAHKRLVVFYTNLAVKHHPDSRDEMKPLIRAVRHACLAGESGVAWESLYIDRIQRRESFYNTRQLGAISEDLALLANFFDSPWKQPLDGFPRAKIGLLFHHVGFDLRELGRLEDAAEVLGAALTAYAMAEDWGYATRAAGHLSNLYLTSGELQQAESTAQLSMDYAYRINIPSRQRSELMKRMAARGSALHQQGNIEAALSDMRVAESLQQLTQPESKLPFLGALRGYQYCDILLDLCEWSEVELRAQSILKMSTAELWPTDIALAQLTLARLGILQFELDDRKEFARIEYLLTKAISFFQNAEYYGLYGQCLLAKAQFLSFNPESPIAIDAIAEASEVATFSGMRLLDVDIKLHQANRYLRIDELSEARTSLRKVRKVIDETGYHRRDPDRLITEARLELALGNLSVVGHLLKELGSIAERLDSVRWRAIALNIENRLRQ